MDNGASFGKKENAAFNSGGEYSTPAKRRKDDSGDFLMPAERKYPYKIDGKISCKLLRAAMSRAGQQGATGVAKRAKSLYTEHCAS
jgi:hypothetical protein